MLKSSIRARTFAAMYRLLDQVSPLAFDCGLLCGAACCMQDGTEEELAELGMNLLPGEEKIHDRKDGWLTWHEDRAEDYDYPPSWKGRVYFVQCRGPAHCRREKRPLQCRTFPLTPHLDEDGTLLMVLNDIELPYECPLTDPEMTMALQPSFVKATHTVWNRLVQDALIRDLVVMDSEERDAVTVVYDPAGRYAPGDLLLTRR